MLSVIGEPLLFWQMLQGYHLFCVTCRYYLLHKTQTQMLTQTHRHRRRHRYHHHLLLLLLLLLLFWRSFSARCLLTVFTSTRRNCSPQWLGMCISSQENALSDIRRNKRWLWPTYTTPPKINSDQVWIGAGNMIWKFFPIVLVLSENTENTEN